MTTDNGTHRVACSFCPRMIDCDCAGKTSTHMCAWCDDAAEESKMGDPIEEFMAMKFGTGETRDF